MEFEDAHYELVYLAGQVFELIEFYDGVLYPMPLAVAINDLKRAVMKWEDKFMNDASNDDPSWDTKTHKL